jgi:glycosyltransferase involved in cell wall biosynthesis
MSARRPNGVTPVGSLRIGFTRMGPHPIPNRLLVQALAAALPGAQISVLDLEARARGDRAAMLANAPFVAAEHGRNLARGRVRPWQAFFTTTFMFRWMSRCAREWAQRHRFDWTIQIQSLFDARAPGIPHFVYTDHTHLANLDYSDFDRRALRAPRWIALETALYRAAHVVFTRSAHVSASLIDRYGCAPERAVCVGAGSNARAPDRPIARSDLGRDVLFVGVDWERKGGPDLAAAFERVRRRHGTATLTVVGCEPRLALPGARVVGRCPVEEIHRHYERADVFCLPTRREPFGVAFVEALHHGLPIVATRIGAVPDLVESGRNGFLVDVGDVDGLAARLEQLLGDPALRRQMGAAGWQRARRYTWSAVADRIAAEVRAATPRGHIAALPHAPGGGTLDDDATNAHGLDRPGRGGRRSVAPGL